MTNKCKVCEKLFHTDKELLLHLETTHGREFCFSCATDLGEHICLGKGSSGFEINFCLKAGGDRIRDHVPHPRLCEKCERLQEEKYLQMLSLSDEMQDLEEKLSALRAKHDELKNSITRTQETRIKLFCGHGQSKNHCPVCKEHWTKFDAEREKARLEAIKLELNPPPAPKPLTKKDRAHYVHLPR